MDGFEAVAVGWGRSKALFAGWDALFRNRLMGDKPSRAFQAASTHGEDAGGQLISKVSKRYRTAVMNNLKDRNQRRMFHEVAFLNVRMGS